MFATTICSTGRKLYMVCQFNHQVLQIFKGWVIRMRTMAVNNVHTVCTVETMARTMTIVYTFNIVAVCLIECLKGQSRKWFTLYIYVRLICPFGKCTTYMPLHFAFRRIGCSNSINLYRATVYVRCEVVTISTIMSWSTGPCHQISREIEVGVQHVVHDVDRKNRGM